MNILQKYFTCRCLEVVLNIPTFSKALNISFLKMGVGMFVKNAHKI